MSLYFLRESMRSAQQTLRESNELPIKIQRSTWEHMQGPNRIAKNYTFDSIASLREFVNRVLQEPHAAVHPIKMTIDDMTVLVELYTRDLDDVTSVDLDIARACDEIHDEVSYIVEDAYELPY